MARSRFMFLSSLTLILFVTVAWHQPARSEEAKAGLSVTAKPGEWRYLNSDPLSTRYSPLAQIDKDNFKDLKIAWRWKPAIGPAPPSLGGTAQGNGDPKLAMYRSESTPIMANGVLYTAAGGQRVVAAIDAATGRQLWMWMGMDEDGRDRKAQGEMRDTALRIGRTARTSGFSSSRPASISWRWTPGRASR